jgi:ATP/maltotriose-dependent transcriptional regulator MalT
MSPAVGAKDPLSRGRSALERGEWAEAGDHFEAAAAAGDSPEAWEGVSRAAWWRGDQEATIEARKRAFRGYRQAGDTCGAARMAMWVASDHLDFIGDEAVASAWLRRGRSLLEDQPPCPEQGFITLLEADIALLAHGDPVGAQRGAREALELARATGDVDIETIALAILGSALIASGAVEEGLERLDESAAIAVAEEFGDTATPGWALCHTVSGCAQAGDFGRAEQWSRALHSWSATWRARHFFGICRTAYGGVLTTRGEWLLAEEELSAAMEDIQTTRPALAAPTAVRLGELRLRQGRPDEARELFESALPYPYAAVGLGELDLQTGDSTAAAEAAERVLRRLGEANVLDRFPALELLARARAAAGDADAAREAMEQLQAAGLATPYMRGRVRLLRAEVLAAVGDCDGARRAAEDAIDLFADCSAPYEAALARRLLAGALEALGRGERAEAEAQAANEVLELLGASGTASPGATGNELSPREVDILRLVAEGFSDARIADRLFLSPHTVHRHVANIRTKLRTSSRAAAVAQATKLGLI